MRSDRTHYEVRCLECAVTFPVETKNCFHCGAATVAMGGTGEISHGATPSFDFESTLAGGENTSAWSTFDEPESYPDDRSSTQPAPFEEHSTDDAPTPSAGRSILGSMGSLIWIAMLIAFSIANQMCDGVE